MSESKAKCAAEYIRMSTDAQDLSPAIQRTAIHAYAGSRGLSIVESYFDAGRSGLTLHKRPAMKRLLADVTDAQCQFGVVLVYDISRWGRFQDTDASAYYEYHCRLHDVDVRYVQEPFAPSGTPLDALYKGMKRIMAAEYSRELAVKTIAGQSAALDLGFHIGSLPCIGVGRVAVAKSSGEQRLLGATEHKAMSREHVRWVRGPEEEVQLVQRIFHLYGTTGISVSQLAEQLAEEGHRARDGRPISRWRIATLLASEVFIGNFVWGREKQGLRRDEGDVGFRRIEGCFEPVVSHEEWGTASRKRAKRGGVIRTKPQLLADLERALQVNPALTASDLQLHQCASRSTYVKWFGSFQAALALIAREPHKRSAAEYQDVAKTRALGWTFCNAAAAMLSASALQCERISQSRGGQSMLINGIVRIRVQVIWRRDRYGLRQWMLRKVYRELFDHVLIVRLLDDDSVFDSLLLSRKDYFGYAVWFSDALPAGTVMLQTADDVVNCFRALQSATRT